MFRRRYLYDDLLGIDVLHRKPRRCTDQLDDDYELDIDNDKLDIDELRNKNKLLSTAFRQFHRIVWCHRDHLHLAYPRCSRNSHPKHANPSRICRNSNGLILIFFCLHKKVTGTFFFAKKLGAEKVPSLAKSGGGVLGPIFGW